MLYREVSFIRSVLYRRFHCIHHMYEDSSSGPNLRPHKLPTKPCWCSRETSYEVSPELLVHNEDCPRLRNSRCTNTSPCPHTPIMQIITYHVYEPKWIWEGVPLLYSTFPPVFNRCSKATDTQGNTQTHVCIHAPDHQ